VGRIFLGIRGDLDFELAGAHPVGVSALNAKKLLEKDNALKNIEGVQ